MRIIEISALENGAHRNQHGNGSTIPEGWAVIPDALEIPVTFPFVNITVEGQTVTGITAGIVPPPAPAPDSNPTAQEDTDEMLIDHELRLTMLELGIFE